MKFDADGLPSGAAQLADERLHVREASLVRCCWKQGRLGRHSDPAVQEKALTGNTIFFAQPTADVPSMEMPPPPDAFVDSLNVIFTRSLHDLSKAEWASVDREQYMRIIEERKLQCLAFSNVQVRHDLAATRLPRVGVPEHIAACRAGRGRAEGLLDAQRRSSAC